MHYCGINRNIPQYKKCEFIVINSKILDKEAIPFGEITISHAKYLTLLGSNLACTNRLDDDINSDYCSRFRSCIKYCNFIRSNKLAPLSVKLKVLMTCVITSLLYNCETFSYMIPKVLESQYYKVHITSTSEYTKPISANIVGIISNKGNHTFPTIQVLSTFFSEHAT